MHEFLDQIYFDNTLREYTIALAIILLGFLFKRFIARYIALFISYLIIKRYKDINKTAFRDQVARPLGFFIIVFIIVVALDKLNFPHKLDITIYHLNLKELFRMVSSAILINSFFQRCCCSQPSAYKRKLCTARMIATAARCSLPATKPR